MSATSPPSDGARMRGADRRAVIEAAASELFAECGYAGTSIAQIAAAAGITKPVVYLHFSSKKELHLTLLARHRDQLLGRLAADMREPLPLAERIPRVADRWFAYVRENPYAWRMLFADTTADPEIAAFHAQMQATARSALVALLQAESHLQVAKSEIEMLAEILRSSMTALASWWLEHPRVPRSRLVAAVVTGLWDGLSSRVE